MTPQKIMRQRRIIVKYTFKLVTNAALAGRILEAKLRGQEWTLWFVRHVTERVH